MKNSARKGDIISYLRFYIFSNNDINNLNTNDLLVIEAKIRKEKFSLYFLCYNTFFYKCISKDRYAVYVIDLQLK